MQHQINKYNDLALDNNLLVLKKENQITYTLSQYSLNSLVPSKSSKQCVKKLKQLMFEFILGNKPNELNQNFAVRLYIW